MADRIDAAFQIAMEAIVETAPEAPELPAIPRRTGHPRARTWRLAALGAAAVVVLTITVGWIAFRERGDQPTMTAPTSQVGNATTISTDPLIVQPEYGVVVVPEGVPHGIPEAQPLSPLGSLELIGDVLVAGGGYNHPELAAAAFPERIKDLLEIFAPLADGQMSVTLHGVAENHIVMSWSVLTHQGPGTCIAEFLGNAGGAGCGTELPASIWTQGDGPAFGAYVVPPEVAWIEIWIDGQLVEWQTPRAGAVALNVNNRGRGEILVKFLDESGALVAQDFLSSP